MPKRLQLHSDSPPLNGTGLFRLLDVLERIDAEHGTPAVVMVGRNVNRPRRTSKPTLQIPLPAPRRTRST